MKITQIGFAFLFISASSMLPAQAPPLLKEPASATATEPLIVDVHSSPYRRSIIFHTNVSPQRFDMRGATVFEMIEFAYNLGEQDDDRENSAIIGGPTWIDLDRFDVSAMIPALKPPAFNTGRTNPANTRNTPEDQFRPILKRVLAERFHLKYHAEDRPLPGFIVTIAKDGLKLAKAKAPAAEGNCQGVQDKENPAQFTLACTSETMAQFIAARDQDFPQPIVDRTGLTKPYDFTLKLSLGPDVHTRDDRAASSLMRSPSSSALWSCAATYPSLPSSLTR